MEAWVQLIVNVGFAVAAGGYLVVETQKTQKKLLEIVKEMTETQTKQTVLIDKIYDKVVCEDEGDV